MPTITPFLSFNGRAEEAVAFYQSVFPGTQVLKVVRQGKAGPLPEGSVLTLQFRLLGQEFVALNGGPPFAFSLGVSFVVNCDTQDEVDHYWERLAADGGQHEQCGWLTDKFGLAWQITPRVLPEMIGSSDAAAAERAMRAMMTMRKLHIAALQRAYDAR